MTTLRARINWRSKSTGATGHGEYCLDTAYAQNEVDRLNKEFTELEHWYTTKDFADTQKGE